MILYKLTFYLLINVLLSIAYCNIIDKIFRSKSWNSKYCSESYEARSCENKYEIA